MVKVKIGMIGALDMLKFKNMSKVREDAIQAAEPKEITANFAINNNAHLLHPDYQKLVVDEVIDHGTAEAKTFVFRSANKQPLAYFRAGQYISLKLKIGDSYLSRPYSISSSPKEALQGKVAVTVRSVKDGFAAEWMLKNLKEGDELTASSGLGNFYYEDLRDSKNVIALAGGSGITPFLSMAKAIAEGTENFNLTILYGSNTEEQILFKNELEEITNKCDKVKVVHVLSNEEKEGYEHGFITSDLILKYAIEPYSIFVCGPEAMYRFLKEELKKLYLERRSIRFEMLGVTKHVEDAKDYPAEAIGKTFSLTIRQGTQEWTIPARADESVLVAIERAGIIAPSRCRSGECGWCRTKVLKGSYYAPAENEFRRYSDKVHNYIHACSSFPVSDMELEVPNEYVG